MADQHDPNGAYSEVFEEGLDARQAQTVHRIRANSSIMQLKKILGERKLQRLIEPPPKLGQMLISCLGILQWPIEEKFVSAVLLHSCLC
jgi:hypothetical protein